MVWASSGSHAQRVTECLFSARSLARVVPHAPAPTTPIRSIGADLLMPASPAEQEQPGEPEERRRHEGKADHLGGPQRSQHQAVDSQPLDEKPTERIEPQVTERKGSRGVLQPA